MKKIYLVLTFTGTALSRIIRMFTKNEFTHISISLDQELKQMYSFGRLNPYNAFVGGFVHEYVDKGTFKRFYKTYSKIYYLEITDDQYEKIYNIIKEIEEKKEEYNFNILGLFAAGFNIRIKKEQSFYCAEFVKNIMEKAGINTNLPEIIKPIDFESINGLTEVYEGLLKNYIL